MTTKRPQPPPEETPAERDARTSHTSPPPPPKRCRDLLSTPEHRWYPSEEEPDGYRRPRSPVDPLMLLFALGLLALGALLDWIGFVP